jgi:hypothetical protein
VVAEGTYPTEPDLASKLMAPIRFFSRRRMTKTNKTRGKLALSHFAGNWERSGQFAGSLRTIYLYFLGESCQDQQA